MKVNEFITYLTYIKPNKSQNNKECKRMTKKSAQKLYNGLKKILHEFLIFPEYPIEDKEYDNLFKAIQPRNDDGLAYIIFNHLMK